MSPTPDEILALLLSEQTLSEEEIQQHLDALKDPSSDVSKICRELQRNCATWPRIFDAQTNSLPDAVLPSEDSIRAKMQSAAALERNGDHKAALQLRLRAQDDCEVIWGEMDERFATSAHTVARSLFNLGRYHEASDQFDYAAALRAAILGERAPSVSISLIGQGQALSVLGNLSKSITVLELAVAISEESLGKRHPDTAVAVNALACALLSADLAQEAQFLFERVLDIDIEMQGEESTPAVMDRIHLAETYSAQGKMAESLKIADELLPMLKDLEYEAPADFIWASNSLGEVQLAAQNIDRAYELFERAEQLGMYEQLGPSLDLVAVQSNLGMIAWFRGENVRAADLLRRAISDVEYLLGPETSQLSDVHANLRYTLSRVERDAAAQIQALADLGAFADVGAGKREIRLNEDMVLTTKRVFMDERSIAIMVCQVA